jgi:hypothetical protein
MTGVSDLGAMLALLLAVSLATERLVTIAKTTFPQGLADDRRNEAGEVDLVADRSRRLVLQAVALVGAWITSALIASRGQLTPEAFLGVVHAGTVAIPAPVVALLACGGSAFWAQVVQYVGAVKDIAATRRASESLVYRRQAEGMGVTPVASGQAARTQQTPAGDKRTRLLLQLRADAPDRLHPPGRSEP